ncbi:MAG: hypothetical protein KDK51_01955 [Deltaproteobacteria bacterium]|nr:hypothetical protein [Deltaproteobacteria bacterium]
MNAFIIGKFHYQQIMRNRSIITIIVILSLLSIIGIAFRFGIQNFIPLPGTDHLLFTFSMWNAGALIYCIFYAAGLFDQQLQQRYFTATISRPIYFWEFQLGHFLSIYYVFLSMSLLSIIIMTFKALVYESAFPDHFVLILFDKWIGAASFIMIVLSIGFVFRKSSTIAIFFIVTILASIFSTVGDPPHPLLKVMKYILYIITPAERTMEITDETTLMNYDFLYHQLENISMLLYAGTLMILSNLYYTKKDYPLRGQ